MRLERVKYKVWEPIRGGGWEFHFNYPTEEELEELEQIRIAQQRHYREVVVYR